jgi:hypothetical protein
MILLTAVFEYNVFVEGISEVFKQMQLPGIIPYAKSLLTPLLPTPRWEPLNSIVIVDAINRHAYRRRMQRQTKRTV